VTRCVHSTILLSNEILILRVGGKENSVEKTSSNALSNLLVSITEDQPRGRCLFHRHHFFFFCTQVLQFTSVSPYFQKMLSFPTSYALTIAVSKFTPPILKVSWNEIRSQEYMFHSSCFLYPSLHTLSQNKSGTS